MTLFNVPLFLNRIRPILLLFLLMSGFLIHAKPPVFTGEDFTNHPSKVIRACCAFGVDLSIARIPFIRKTDITSIQTLGRHQYLGHTNEGNGIIYTKKGGFLDIAHIRDLADWTGYLYHIITRSAGKKNGKILNLGSEAGKKELTLKITKELTSEEICHLAGMIAYDNSVWHEIASWFGASYIPLMPERYSSFSPEDLYSNLLGVQLGIQAIMSDLEYNEAMTLLLASTLDSLDAVENMNDTYTAMLKVKGLWWSNERPLPSRRILLKRYLANDETLFPWRLKEDELTCISYDLCKSSSSLEDYYEFSVNLYWPFYKRASECKINTRKITQKDFGQIIICIDDQVNPSLKK